MRKSGPFPSIRLWAYSAVGAESGVAAVVVPGSDVAVEASEAAGWLAGLDRRCQIKNPSKRMQTEMGTATRARIQYHSMCPSPPIFLPPKNSCQAPIPLTHPNTSTSNLVE